MTRSSGQGRVAACIPEETTPEEVATCLLLSSAPRILVRRLRRTLLAALAAAAAVLLDSSCHSLRARRRPRIAAGSIPYFGAVPLGRIRRSLSSRMPPNRRLAPRSKMALRRFSLPSKRAIRSKWRHVWIAEIVKKSQQVH